MSASVPLLCPFGTTAADAWFNTAMSWEKPRIFQFLDNCSTGQEGGPATQNPATQESLAKIAYAIKGLSHTDGEYYTAPAPACHIRRELNAGYNAAEPLLSNMFNIIVFPMKYKFDKKEGTTDDKDWLIPFYNPYDLLGLFLALLGPAEQGASQYNYFLPLTAVYVRWCSRIAGSGRGAPQPAGTGPWPFMFQCSWRAISKADPRVVFFLGASLGGDNFNQDGRGNVWREILQRRRFDAIFRSGGYSVFKLGDFNNINDVIPGATNNPGNCAETYPMLHMLQGNRRFNGAVYGLSLRRDVPMRKKWPTSYDETHYRGFLTAPCMTCSHALGTAGCYEDRFLDGVP